MKCERLLESNRQGVSGLLNKMELKGGKRESGE